MRYGARHKLLGWACILGLPSAYIASEVRWHRVNNPEGRFSTVAEYLASGRLSAHVAKSDEDGHTYLIALGRKDTWLAMPSGPAAYVFDEAGIRVDWSSDSGDDPKFQNKWLLQSMPSSLEELERLADRIDRRSGVQTAVGS